MPYQKYVESFTANSTTAKANTITFIVDMVADKQQIRDEFEKVFDVKVAKVNLLVTPDGKKKAFVKLKPEFKAGDVATKLGVV